MNCNNEICFDVDLCDKTRRTRRKSGVDVIFVLMYGQKHDLGAPMR